MSSNKPIQIDADLVAFIEEMASRSMMSVGGYTNQIVEKGIRIELEDAGYTEESIWFFMDELHHNKVCNWSLLNKKETE